MCVQHAQTVYVLFVWLVRTVYICRIWPYICRDGQNHIYTVYIRYFWQGNHQIYGHIRCIYTVLANPKYMVTSLHKYRIYTVYIYIYIFWPTLVVCAFILTLATRMGHWECSLPVLRFYSSIVCELVRLNETGNTYHTPCMNVYIYIQEFPAKATVCCTL
jgi:hypothetical protein